MKLDGYPRIKYRIRLYYVNLSVNGTQYKSHLKLNPRYPTLSLKLRIILFQPQRWDKLVQRFNLKTTKQHLTNKL